LVSVLVSVLLSVSVGIYCVNCLKVISGSHAYHAPYGIVFLTMFAVL